MKYVKGLFTNKMNRPLPVGTRGFGERLEWAITEGRGIQKADFAREINKSPSQLSNWLGRDDAPSEDVVMMLSERLGVSPAWLRYGVAPTDEAPKPRPTVVRETRPAIEPPTPEEVRDKLSRFLNDPHRANGVEWVPKLVEMVLQRGFSDSVTFALVAEIFAGGRNHTAYGDAMASVQRAVWLTAAENGAASRRDATDIPLPEHLDDPTPGVADNASKTREVG